MADTSVLPSNVINRTAFVGATPSHGSVKTGDLPLVQVRQPPVGPQVQEGQQKPVTILSPKDAEAAVRTGGLPMVKVKMVDGKPKADDGVNEKVVIRDSRHGPVSAGSLPMVHVKMADGKPQIQTLPNVQGGPPQIPAASPALSSPRAAPAVGAPAPGQFRAAPAVGAPAPGQFRAAPAVGAPRAPYVARVARVAAPQALPPPPPALAPDQLMLCRHLLERFADDLRARGEVPDESVADHLKLAGETISAIDQELVAAALRAEVAAAQEAAPVQAAPCAPQSESAPAASIVPVAPSVSYVAGRVGGRGQFVAGPRAHRGAGLAPRGVARPSAPLPPVVVTMEGGRAVVQPPVAPESPSEVTAVPVVASSDAGAEGPAPPAAELAAELAAENAELRRQLEEAQRALAAGAASGSPGAPQG